MKTTHKQTLIAAALGCVLGAMTATAQTEPGFNTPITLAPAEAGYSGSSGTEEDEKAKTAELAKKLQNPVANLISAPIQNNWDFGHRPCRRDEIHGQPGAAIRLVTRTRIQPGTNL